MYINTSIHILMYIQCTCTWLATLVHVHFSNTSNCAGNIKLLDMYMYVTKRKYTHVHVAALFNVFMRLHKHFSLQKAVYRPILAQLSDMKVVVYYFLFFPRA